MKAPSLAYVVLRCADLERSRVFYEALGLRLTEEQHGRGPRHYSARLGEVVLELYPLSDRPRTVVRLGLKVANLNAVIESLEHLKATVVRLGGQRPDSALVNDPDGHQVALSWAE